MASRSSRTRSSTSRISDEEINDLVLKLQALLPECNSRGTSRVAASKILKEICSYIKSLHREVDDLSERLSELLASADTTGTDIADMLRSLLQQ